MKVQWEVWSRRSTYVLCLFFFLKEEIEFTGNLSLQDYFEAKDAPPVTGRLSRHTTKHTQKMQKAELLHVID